MSAYNLGPVKPWVEAAANEIGPQFNVTGIGGYRTSATDPNGHPAGRALDFMTFDKAAGDGIAAYAKKNWKRLGVEYIIWRQRIWSVARSGEGWRAMEDRGSITANHYDHVHVNFIATAPPGFKAGPTITVPDPTGAASTSTPASTTGTAGGSTGSTSQPAPAAGPSATSETGGDGVQEQLMRIVIIAGVVGTGVALVALGAARASRPARDAGREAVGDGVQLASIAVPQLRAAGAAASLSKGTRT